jgi:hypothetical protein
VAVGTVGGADRVLRGGRRWRCLARRRREQRKMGEVEEGGRGKEKRLTRVGPSIGGILNFLMRNLVFLELELVCVPNTNLAPRTPKTPWWSWWSRALKRGAEQSQTDPS